MAFKYELSVCLTFDFNLINSRSWTITSSFEVFTFMFCSTNNKNLEIGIGDQAEFREAK